MLTLFVNQGEGTSVCDDYCCSVMKQRTHAIPYHSLLGVLFEITCMNTRRSLLTHCLIYKGVVWFQLCAIYASAGCKGMTVYYLYVCT